MKRPAAANLKRKAEEPLEEVEPDAVQQADGENDGPDHDQADEGRKATATRPKKQAGCSCRSVCDVCSVFGFVSQLLFITGKHTGLPVTWMEVVQPCIKAVSCLPLYSESCGVSESMSGCPKSTCFEALSLEAGKDLSVVEDAFEQEKEALAKLTAQRRAERAVR